MQPIKILVTNTIKTLEMNDEIHPLINRFVDLIGEHAFWLTFGVIDKHNNNTRTTYLSKIDGMNGIVWKVFNWRRHEFGGKCIQKEDKSLLACMEYLFCDPQVHIMYHPVIIDNEDNITFDENPNETCDGGCQELPTELIEIKVEMVLTRPVKDTQTIEEITYTINRRPSKDELLRWMVATGESCYHDLNKHKKTKSARSQPPA